MIILAALSIPIRSETLKEQVIALLSEELESEVTIEKLEGRAFPRVAVSGAGVVIRQKGRTDVPPLITIETFEIRGSLRDLMRKPRRVGEVRLKGLQVKVPPRDGDGEDKPNTPEKTDAQKHADAQKLQQVIIERLEAPDTVITLIPKRAGKQPKVFTVHHLVMDGLGINETIPYIAVLTNPVPKGRDRNLRHVRPVERRASRTNTDHGQIHVCQREPRHHQRSRRDSELNRRIQRS